MEGIMQVLTLKIACQLGGVLYGIVTFRGWLGSTLWAQQRPETFTPHPLPSSHSSHSVDWPSEVCCPRRVQEYVI
jgi:hypothetical protein